MQAFGMFNFLFCSFLRPPSTFPASSETVLGSGRLSAARRSRFGRSPALAWAPCENSFVQRVCLSLSKSVKYRLNSLPGPSAFRRPWEVLLFSAILGVPKFIQKWVPFWVPFWTNFGSQNGPQNGPKTGPGIHNFGVHFWIVLF